MNGYIQKQCEIIPEEVFEIERNCSGCGRKNVFHSTGKFRINANGRKIDVWLIYACRNCRHTYNLPVYSRVSIEDLEKTEYEAMQKNDSKTAESIGLRRSLFRKNGVKIVREPDCRMVCTDLPLRAEKQDQTEKQDQAAETLQLIIRNPSQIRIREDRLIAECLGISRTRAGALLKSRDVRRDQQPGGELVFCISPWH